MPVEPTINIGGICDGCGRQLSWGGTSWYPHDDYLHEVMRDRMVGALHHALVSRVGRVAGHVVVLRFTQRWAWHECACGDRGYHGRWSCVARQTALAHLVAEGHRVLAAWPQVTPAENVSETEERTP